MLYFFSSCSDLYPNKWSVLIVHVCFFFCFFHEQVILFANVTFFTHEHSFHKQRENKRRGFLPHQDFMVCVVCLLPLQSAGSITVLFKVLWSTVLARADLCCRVVCRSVLNHSVRWNRRRRDAERKKRRASDGVRGRDRGRRESPGEVNGWNARWGSVNELHAGLGGTGGIVSRQQGSQWLWLTPKQHFMADDTG